jgi:hypothetical protein
MSYVALSTNLYTKVVAFITTAIQGGVGDSGARINRLLNIVNNPKNYSNLVLELMCVVVVARPLVQSTYKLEGDGPVALIAFDEIERINYWFNTHMENLSFPTMLQVINEFEGVLLQYHDGSIETFKSYIRAMIEPVHLYFNSRINGMMEADVAIYKTARFVNPISVAAQRPGVAVVTNLITVLNRFTDDDVILFTQGLSEYQRLATNFVGTIDKEKRHHYDEMQLSANFWRENRFELPNLSRFTQFCFTLTASSAAAERVSPF